tara:strand:+ start:1216 stop:1638 length:423 start_codon:yes stop_codon:yes gene_type:complete
MSKNFKVLKIDHIGIAVKNIKQSGRLFNELLGMDSSKEEIVEAERVVVKKVAPKDSISKLELIEGLYKDSVVSKYVDKKGQGIHHIALEVDNIYNAIQYLDSNDINIIYKEPKLGSDNKLITFIHPSSASGILIELCQKQ